jgi:predicted transcriptional regulator
MQNTIEKPRPTTVTLKLDASSRERLKSLAITKKRSSHYLMKEAIERYLKAEEVQQVILTSVDDSVAHF